MFVSSCSTNGAVTGMGKSSSDALVLARVGETAQGFVQPLAPSRSAAPSSKLPKLGRDKHKMPFYHPAQRTRVVRTTAYTHSERDHLAYGPRNAVGTALKYTSSVRSAAADWSVYPLGTTFRIKGQPYLYVVDDYGSALVGTGTIDIYQPNKKLMKEWGPPLCGTDYRPLGRSRQQSGGARQPPRLQALPRHVCGPAAPRFQGVLCQGRLTHVFHPGAAIAAWRRFFIFRRAGGVVIWRHEYGKTGFHCPGGTHVPVRGSSHSPGAP